MNLLSMDKLSIQFSSCKDVPIERKMTNQEQLLCRIAEARHTDELSDVTIEELLLLWDDFDKVFPEVLPGNFFQIRRLKVHGNRTATQNA